MYCRDDLTVTEIFKYSNNYCESQMLEIKELEILLINCYRPPGAPLQLFEETLAKCQETINKVDENVQNKIKTILALGDFNFPFIQWPSSKIYNREQEPEHMASEKRQGKMLLEWADSNFMEQHIKTPTRKGNILDLVFTNSPNLITDYSTIVNQNFSDHNTLKINLNLKDNNGAEKIRKNPYPN